MNLNKLLDAFAALTKWVKDGLATKQSKVIVKTVAPLPADGKDGDICVVIDP